MSRTLKHLSACLVMAGTLAATAMAPTPARADVSISIGVNAWSAPPPSLPVYAQPMIPGPGYIWTPGYWAISPAGYYWVPGAWVLPPFVGALWTPGYWAFVGSAYRWHPGYWSRAVGYYGGINYGYGYFGRGYAGGYWNRDRFYYNRAVNNINLNRVSHVYHRKVEVHNPDRRRISYNGGRDGIHARPSRAEQDAQREHRTPATRDQDRFRNDAARDRNQFVDRNHGRPPRAAIADRQDDRRDQGGRPDVRGGGDQRPDVNRGNAREPGRRDDDARQRQQRDAQQRETQQRQQRDTQQREAQQRQQRDMQQREAQQRQQRDMRQREAQQRQQRDMRQRDAQQRQQRDMRQRQQDQSRRQQPMQRQESARHAGDHRGNGGGRDN